MFDGGHHDVRRTTGGNGPFDSTPSGSRNRLGGAARENNLSGAGSDERGYLFASVFKFNARAHPLGMDASGITESVST
jgi:hypothetical protein